ncbi:hypothetical protein [Sandaracinus amylolyticus]|uniref:hypothetical protein n=1 Tax=Sandaracinus amylolyticus TaxID=927083 RepID=UPI001F36FF0B|nr:hypothetical protein [Sandaracinus amylolyticus]UJR78195.1 Hypothetical protein I5071_2220 [Sandaracinus amylolyticus]
MSRSFSVPTLALAAGLTSLVVGCVSDVDRRAQEGIDALDRCDVRGAHEAFEDAHEMDETRGDIALAYALTDLATLVEDPAITALAPRLGFDREIDTALLWGPDGLLDRLGRDESCESIEAWNEESFPHPAVRDPEIAFWGTVDPRLTIGEVRDALVAISPRLERVSLALQRAADHVQDGGVTIEGGCGLATTPTRVQSPELLALAAGLEAVRATARAAQGYDGSIPVVMIFRGATADGRGAWIDAMNAGFLRPVDDAAIADSRAMFRVSAQLVRRAVPAASAVRLAPPASDAIFDWNRIPVRVLDDVYAFAVAIDEALEVDGAHTIPRLSPELDIDLGSFFRDPFDGTAGGPLWSIQRDEELGDEWIQLDGAVLESLLADRFSTNPWAADAPSYEWEIDWSDIERGTWESVFDPGARWTNGYACAE